MVIKNSYILVSMKKGAIEMIRLEIEEREGKMLAPWATLARESKGRIKREVDDPVRTCFMRDRDRIIHSKAFRRLKHKTQVYISPSNDHYRTRLTHTLEVAQIAQTVGRALQLNEDLIEAIALAHDVGHTPFAHTGEDVLNQLVSKGFKHNENSVRVLTTIEQRHGERGLNLCAEVLNGVFFHSGYGGKDPRCAATLEGQLIRLSDKIAYVQHDIDDSVRAGIITNKDLPEAYTTVLGHTHSSRIACLVNDLIDHTRERFGQMSSTNGVCLAFSPLVDEALQGLRKFMFDEVYRGSVCSLERERAGFIIAFLFDHYTKRWEELPDFYRIIAEEEGVEQGVADYISGMSDNYCVELFKELTIPRSFINF